MPHPEPARKVRLSYGELTTLAAELGRSVSHLSHYLAGRRPNKTLDLEFTRRYGVTWEHIVTARSRHPEEHVV
ncbi:MAG: hypothetical protein JWL95_2821 [Gemmatimonadetes bacterium]|nr:hypothetical protein [Gemmatimonadota bacterium]